MATSLLDMTRTIERDGTHVVHVGGEVDMSSAGRLREELMNHVALDRPIAVDLHNVVFIDSRGLGALLAIAKCVSGAGRGVLRLRNVPAHVKRVFDAADASLAFRIESISF